MISLPPPRPTFNYYLLYGFRFFSDIICDYQYSLAPGDAQKYLNAAMQVVQESNPEEPIAVVEGQGSTVILKDIAKRLRDVIEPQHLKVDFEWKIASLPEDFLAKRVQKWRYDVCGGTVAYQRREIRYLEFLHDNGLNDPRMGMRKLLQYTSGKRHQLEFRSHYQPEKRGAEEMGQSQELEASSKRLSMDSQPESVSSLSVMSPNISRQEPVAGWGEPTMDPPPPTHMGRQRSGSRRGSRGSRGSAGSATARVTESLEALTVQSSSWGSLQGMASPFEGSTWGGRPGVARNVPEQFSGGYEAPTPGSGYQGPGRVPETSSHGQLTEVYGHLQYVEPVRPHRPQVGIEHTQFQGGGWNPPQSSWQQRAPADQAAAHRSYPPAQRAHSGSGHNVPVPSPHVQVGGSYPPRFPPAEPAMHGRGTYLAQQPRHMAMVPPLGVNPRPIFADMPMAESPQLYPADPQLGQGNIPSSVPPNVSPILQSLPPPVMDDIDLSQLQAPATVPPVDENCPFSAASTTESMHAGLIALPEHEDAPAESESYGRQEELTGGDEYSDREDDQFSHQDTSGGEAPLYPGEYDNGRFYHSPIPSGGDQTVHQDPYWGGYESEDEIGQD